MMKSSGVLPKPLLSIVALLLFIFGIVALYWQLSLIMTNPCWKNVMEGMEAMERENFDDTTLVMNGECVTKAVFTPSKYTCELTCNENSDEDNVRECTEKCDKGTGEAKSFIVLLPVERSGMFGLAERGLDAIQNGGFSWIFEGKPTVFTLNCEIEKVNLGQGWTDVNGTARCLERDGSWTCKPLDDDDASSVNIQVIKSEEGKTCTIEKAV